MASIGEEQNLPREIRLQDKAAEVEEHVREAGGEERAWRGAGSRRCVVWGGVPSLRAGAGGGGGRSVEGKAWAEGDPMGGAHCIVAVGSVGGWVEAAEGGSPPWLDAASP